MGITEWGHEVLQHEHRFRYGRDHEVQEEKLPCRLMITLASQMDVIDKRTATKLCHPKSKDVNIIDIIIKKKKCIKVKLTNYNLEYF